ncbi:MAG: acyl carrier protein [Clostridia bacterium]|nr:acyl carrier protein [Clostridia bacterium]
MFEDVKKLLAKQLKFDESAITPDSKIMEDLGADSLDVLQILMTIEEEHGIVIPDEALAEFRTVNDIVNYVEGLNR